MNYFSFLFLQSYLLFAIIKAAFEPISLKYESNNYYIPIKNSKNSNFEYFIFSNILPISIFPSSKCIICQSYHINEKDNNSYSFIKDNVLVPYYYLNFSGDLYESNITLGSQSILTEFIAFDDISYIEEYNGKGRFSLSFLNYFFNTSKKIFAISLNMEGGQLDLGDYNQSKIETDSKLKTFNITKTNYNNTYEYQNAWYINFNSLSINNKIVVENYTYKLTLDISTDYFHIPKDFFFKYADKIFSESSKCQVQPEGHFICICNKNINDKFSNFKFMNENNNYIEVNTSDYISYDESNTGSYCEIFIKINYESDLFVAGKYVMNNYYTIFDIDNNQLKIYPTNKEILYFDQRNVIIFLFALSLGGLVFLCCYFIYKKFCSRDPIDEENINEDLIQENEGEGNIEQNEGDGNIAQNEGEEQGQQQHNIENDNEINNMNIKNEDSSNSLINNDNINEDCKNEIKDEINEDKENKIIIDNNNN